MSPDYEKRREYFKRRYQEKRAEIRAKQRAYASQPEVRQARLEYERAYRLEHPKPKATPEVIASVVAWGRANPDKRRANTRRYRETHPDRVKAAARAWRLANPDAERATKHRRRAAGGVCANDMTSLRVTCGGVCSYCLRRMQRMTVDHVLPVSRGGSNAVENLVMACSRCNSAKNARTPLEFMFGLPRLGGAA